MIFDVKLLKKVKKHILEDPKRLNMENFAYLCEISDDGPACGTVACIAGWAHLLKHKKHIGTRKVWDIGEDDGIEALSITAKQATILFYFEYWPRVFGVAYVNACTERERAKITARRIDHFIRTKGRE